MLVGEYEAIGALGARKKKRKGIKGFMMKPIEMHKKVFKKTTGVFKGKKKKKDKGGGPEEDADETKLAPGVSVKPAAAAADEEEDDEPEVAVTEPVQKGSSLPWLLIGGAAVVGTAAFLYFRKKRR